MNFTSNDIEVVRSGLEFLSLFERRILISRFWENKTIEEISNEMELTWDEIDHLLTDTIAKMRAFCLEHPHFKLGFNMEAA